MKKRYQALLLALCLVAGMLAGAGRVKAASCKITVSTEHEKVKVGETFTATILVDGEEMVSGVEMTVTYDDEMLEVVSMSPTMSGGDGVLEIMDTDLGGTSQKVSYLVKFKIKKPGASTIRVGNDAQVYNETSGKAMSVASNVLTVMGESAKETSADASLRSLKISGGSMSPKFSKNHTDYQVKVKKGVKKLIISADPSDEKAKVSVQGADELSAGENKIVVIVTAQNGDTREYNIYAQLGKKEEKPTESAESKEPEITKEPEASEQPQPEGSIQASKLNDKIILSVQGQFVLEELEDKTLLPDGYHPVDIEIDSQKVTAYQNLEEGSEFVLLYASHGGTEPCLYQYDKVEHTISRFNHLLLIPEAKDPVPSESPAKAGNHSMVYDVLLIVLAVLCTIFMGTTAMFCGRNKRLRRLLGLVDK